MAGGLDLVAAQRRHAAREALTEVFGQRPLGDMRLLQGGVSGAEVWHILVGGQSFVMRLEPERIALHHRERGYACMRGGAAAGVAPAVHYADARAGVAIMDFVESQPLSAHPGGVVGLVRDLGALIAGLHATPLFPFLRDPDEVVAGVLEVLGSSGLFAPGLLDRHIEGLARIRAVHRWDVSTLVSSHNDPSLRNVIFDGDRLWLVDWELGSRNDPLFDLAIVTINLATTPELEGALLAAALERPADASARAQVAVVRLLARLFYGCIALEAFVGGARSAPETNLDALTPAEFRDARVQMASSSEVAWAFGKMSLRAFVDSLSEPAFQATLDAARASG
jgi:aminoglycoside phosphotransferase (APT) family kinase protein